MPYWSTDQIVKQVEEITPLGKEPSLSKIKDLIYELEDDYIVWLAANFVRQEVTNNRRTKALEIERTAYSYKRPENTLPEQSKVVVPECDCEGCVDFFTARKKTLKHGSINQANGGVLYGCACKWCAESREKEVEYERDRFKPLMKIIQDYTDDMKVQWTEELLSTSFAMPTGELVTWGDATIEQHSVRYEMLLKLAQGNAEAAARHKKAIDELTFASAQTLNNLVNYKEEHVRS